MKPGSPTGQWGPVRTLGHRTPTYLHLSQMWIFLGNTELEIFGYAISKKISRKRISKLNLGIPAHDRAHQSIRLALDAESDIIMNTTVCQSQTEIQFHIWRTHCWQFFWTIDSGVHSIHLLGSSYALSNAPANPVGSHNLFWESNSIKSVKALLNSVWCSTWHNIMKFLVFHFEGHRIDL